MEALLFRNPKKIKAQVKVPKDLIAVVAPSVFLAEQKREELIDSIQKHSGLDEARFKSFGVTILHNVVSHVQLLPDASNTFYTQAGGLIDYALNRTEAAVELFRTYILQNEQELSEAQQLWMYVLLSAGLLQGLGKLYLEYEVQLFNASGQLHKQWNPLTEGIAAKASYYSYKLDTNEQASFRCRLNLLMAQLLMPAEGYHWIISNPEALQVWLALLDEDFESAGTLGALLVRANALAIQRYINSNFSNNKQRVGKLTTFVDTPESIAERERLLAIQFLQWLKNALQNQDIKINKSPLFLVTEGMLLPPEVFKLFIRSHPEYKNWLAIQKGLLSLGIHQQGPAGQSDFRYESHHQQMVNGVILKEFAFVLPDEVVIFHAHTGKEETISSLALLHDKSHYSQGLKQASPSHPIQGLQQLNTEGQWVAMEESHSPRLEKKGG